MAMSRIAGLTVLIAWWCGAQSLNAQSYVDVAASQGLNLFLDTDNYGAGVSFFDFDDDGWDDLTFAMGNDSLAIFRNVEGTLVRLPSPLFLPGITRHVLWVDFDNDGDHDLMTTTFQGRHRLFRNDGDLQFTEISQTAGLLQESAKNFGASFGDLDNDGLLDLYVCTYESDGTPDMYERLNHMYRNNGDGTFTDITLSSGTGNGISFSFQACWMDFDLDGDQDLYIINDRIDSNTMYRNNGDGTFTDVAVEIGADQPLAEPMTLTVGDFDNDGDLDIYMTNTGLTPPNHNRLLRANGDGTYTEVAAQIGLADARWSWGAVWTDRSNDGRLDLYFTTGQPDAPTSPNLFKQQMDGGTFQTALAMVDEPPAIGFACAIGDLDNDGRADIAVHNKAPQRPFLWKHENSGGNHIKITLRGTRSNRMAVGSWVRVHTGGLTQTKYTFCGQDLVSQSSQHMIFGIGPATVVDSVVVTYLSGHTDRYYDLAANQRYWFVEGDTYTAELGASGPLSFCAGGSVTLSAGTHTGYQWNTGSTEATVTVSAPGNYWATVTNEFGVQTITDTLVVEVLPLPDPLASVTNPLCHGDANGSIALDNLSGVPAAEVQWSNGSNGPAIGGLQAGSYGFVFTDINGCTANGSILLTQPDPLEVLFEIGPATDGDNGTIALFIFGGTPPHTITVDGAPGSTLNAGLGPGVYDVVVTDANGCVFAAEAVIADHTGVGGTMEHPARVWPNPTSGLLHWTHPGSLARVAVRDVTGRIVLEDRGRAGALDLGLLAPGRYQVELSGGSGTHRIAVVRE
jgi:hypothetical protein